MSKGSLSSAVICVNFSIRYCAYLWIVVIPQSFNLPQRAFNGAALCRVVFCYAIHIHPCCHLLEARSAALRLHPLLFCFSSRCAIARGLHAL